MFNIFKRSNAKVKKYPHTQIYVDFEKCSRVIASCTTQDHVAVAYKMNTLFFAKHGDYPLLSHLDGLVIKKSRAISNLL